MAQTAEKISKTAEKISKVIKGVEVFFYPKSHQYRRNGKIISSVTTILGVIDDGKSRQLLNWASGLCKNYLISALNNGGINTEVIDVAVKQYETTREAHADIGTNVHDWIEEFVKAKMNGTSTPEIPDDMPPAILNGIMAFLQWYSDNNVKFLASERIVYSEQHNYIGTLDFIAEVNGTLVLGDFKTSNYLHTEVPLQLSAYHHALLEEEKLAIGKYLILHLNKTTGEFREVWLQPEEQYFEIFKSLLTLRRYLADTKKIIGA